MVDETQGAITDWDIRARTLLKVEMTKRNLTYKQLQAQLAEIGVVENEPTIRNKIGRGKFSVAFLLQCLKAMGVRHLDLSGM